MRVISTTDYHTAGEPFRIVTAGVAVPPGATVPQRRRWAVEHLDEVRALLCREPRGHADMYGGFVTPPDDDSADLGVVFFHNDGFSTACGHGTMALATWAIDTGLVRVDPTADHVTVIIDVPSGRVRADASLVGGRVGSVRFHNVPAHAHGLDVELDIDGLPLVADVGYGGAFYAAVDVADLEVSVHVDHLPRLIEWGRAIRRCATEQLDLALPDGRDDPGIYGVIFHETLAPNHHRNVTVFADGQVDRSPCGSGTSARLAMLIERGAIEVGTPFLHDGILGTRFEAQVTGRAPDDGSVRRWETTVRGQAFLTGHHTFVVDPDDELAAGFLLR